MDILDLLWGTPWWVYAIFVYLVLVGIKSLRPDNVSLLRLVIAPLIFIVWSLYSFSGKYGLSLTIVSLWLMSVAIGIFLGWTLLYHGIKINKNNLIHIPGSSVPLLLYMTFFLLKYFLGVNYALDPATQQNIFFWATDVVISGIITGIFGGRFLHVIKQKQL